MHAERRDEIETCLGMLGERLRQGCRAWNQEERPYYDLFSYDQWGWCDAQRNGVSNELMGSSATGSREHRSRNAGLSRVSRAYEGYAQDRVTQADERLARRDRHRKRTGKTPGRHVLQLGVSSFMGAFRRRVDRSMSIS